MGSEATDLRDFLQGSNGIDTSTLSFSFSTSDDVVVSDPEGGPSYPEAAVASKDPTIPGGPATRFTGYDPSGAGPIQESIVSLQVDCWGGTEEDGTIQTDDVHPATAAEELAEAVWQACFDANAASPPSGYEWVAADRPFQNHDTTESPPAYRESTICYLKELNEP